MLLSGGCNSKGRMLNLERLLPTITRIKRETDLILKLHTGLVDRSLAERIVEAEVDVASMEFVGAPESIRDIFGLPFGVESYLETFVNLSDAGMNHIAPHIAVGLHFGRLLGEFNALNLIREHIDPDSLAIIVFRPTRGTLLEHAPPPSPRDVGRVTAHARKLFPSKKILLGSLRPRLSGGVGGEREGGRERGVGGEREGGRERGVGGEREGGRGKAVSGDREVGGIHCGSEQPEERNIRLGIELAAMNNGADAVEIPSPGLKEAMKNRGYRLKRIDSFGILPFEYEDRVGFIWE